MYLFDCMRWRSLRVQVEGSYIKLWIIKSKIYLIEKESSLASSTHKIVDTYMFILSTYSQDGLWDGDDKMPFRFKSKSNSWWKNACWSPSHTKRSIALFLRPYCWLINTFHTTSWLLNRIVGMLHNNVLWGLGHHNYLRTYMSSILQVQWDWSCRRLGETRGRGMPQRA